MSGVLDLWMQTATEIGKPWKIDKFLAMTDLNKGQPKGTSLTAWLRTGGTPTPDARNWTAWRKLDRDVPTDAKTAGHRWAQLKIDFTTSRAGHAAPTQRAFESRRHSFGRTSRKSGNDQDYSAGQG